MVRKKQAARKAQAAALGENVATPKSKAKKQKKQKKAANAPAEHIGRRKKAAIKKQAKAEAEAQLDGADDAIVISSDDEDHEDVVESTETPAAPEAFKSSKAGGAKKRKREAKNPELAKGIEAAFKTRRAVLVRVHPTRPSAESKPLNKALVVDNLVREKLVEAIVACPLTHTAWITESTRAGKPHVSNWFVLCVFTSKDHAKRAASGLEAIFAIKDHPDIHIQASTQNWKKLEVLANALDPDKAIAPRNTAQGEPDNSTEEAISALGKEVERVKLALGWETQPLPVVPGDDAVGPNDVVMGDALTKSQPPPPQLPQPTQLQDPIINLAASTELDKNLAHQALPPAPKQKQDPTTIPPKSAATLPKTTSSNTIIPPAAQVPPAQSSNSKTSHPAPKAKAATVIGSIMDAQSLSQMTYAEQQALQCRYLGEVEPGIPVHGCILCGQRDHLWEICPGRSCQHCGEQDKHTSRACPSVKKCTKCMEKGHTEDQCTSKLKRTLAEAHCERCGDDTHFEDDCSYIWRHIIPEKESVKKAPYLSVFCYNCAARGHWGGDCPEKSKKLRRHYDIFSAKEATKYIDASALPSALLGESLEAVKRGQQEQGRRGGLSIRGAARGNSRAGYNQQPREQAFSSTLKQAPDTQQQVGTDSILSQAMPSKIIKKPKSRVKPTPVAQPLIPLPTVQAQQTPQPARQVHNNTQAPPSAPRATTRPWDTPIYPQQPAPFAPPSQPSYFRPQNMYTTQNYSLTLPVRPSTIRGGDGYVSYRGNQPQPYRPRSQSPVGRNGYTRQRENDFYAGGYASRPQGHYDANGAFHYQGSSRYESYDARGAAPPPPPPPSYGNDYGRRQTFHAVPPPPPASRGGRGGRRGGY